MQLTMEQCDQQIAQIQQQIPELQSNLMKLIGYKQALTELNEDKEKGGEDGSKKSKTSI